MWEPPFPRLTVDRSRGRRGWQDVSQYLKMQATESIFLSRSISQDMFEWQKKGFQWFPVPFVAFFHCWPCRWFEKQFLNVSHSRLWRNPGAKNHEFLDQIIRSESFSTIQISEFVVNGLLGLLGHSCRRVRCTAARNERRMLQPAMVQRPKKPGADHWCHLRFAGVRA